MGSSLDVGCRLRVRAGQDAALALLVRPAPGPDQQVEHETLGAGVATVEEHAVPVGRLTVLRLPPGAHGSPTKGGSMCAVLRRSLRRRAPRPGSPTSSMWTRR